ncbi:uncharacterized protein [Miscanthus floridulus]|uniref:uncharacterized protein n=1 Tax=Miscanthus floridulus TaxID=154761 RepID=UPI00345B4960
MPSASSSSGAQRDDRTRRIAHPNRSLIQDPKVDCLILIFLLMDLESICTKMQVEVAMDDHAAGSRTIEKFQLAMSNLKAKVFW